MSFASTPTTPLPLELIMESPQTEAKHGRSPKPKALIQSLDGASPQSSTKEKNQKLRDNAVTMQLTKTKMCAFFERGKCASTNCRYAHSTSELRLPPNLQKTKLCRAFLASGCTDENCYFAHGETDLRVTEGIYKTQICNFFERGYCKKGDRCNHAHGLHDLRPPAATAATPVGKSMTSPSSMGDASTRPRRSPLPLSELINIDPEAHMGVTPTYSQMLPPTPTKSVCDLAQMGYSPVHSTPLWAQYGMHQLSPVSALAPVSAEMMWPHPPRDAVDMLVQDPYMMSPAMNLSYAMDQSMAMEHSMGMLEQYAPCDNTPEKVLELLSLDASPHRPTPPGLLHSGTPARSLSSTGPTRSSPPGLDEPSQAAPEAQNSPLMVNLSERLASLDSVVLGLGADIASIKSDPAKRLHRI